MARTYKVNLFRDLERRQENGFDYIDREGTFYRSEKLKTQIFKEYNRNVKDRTVDPEVESFADYFEETLSANFMKVSDFSVKLQKILYYDRWDGDSNDAV